MEELTTDGSLKILLVEDSVADALLIEKSLNAAIFEGFHLEKATTLEAALNLLSVRHFDVALLDRTLPDCQNFEGLYSLQNMAPQLPIIFLTAYQDKKAALDAILQGAQDYLMKDKSDGETIKRAIEFAILRKKFERTLILHANFDVLTGLANRMLFESRLEQAIQRHKRSGGMLAIFFLDLDRFKPVNDHYGHAVGDQVLKEVARRLRHAVRRYDTVARFGGDEFAILIEFNSDVHDIEKVAHKILQLFSEPIWISERDMNVGISIGIATCLPGQKISTKTLMKAADAAMYAVKHDHGNGYCIAAHSGEDIIQHGL